MGGQLVQPQPQIPVSNPAGGYTVFPTIKKYSITELSVEITIRKQVPTSIKFVIDLMNVVTKIPFIINPISLRLKVGSISASSSVSFIKPRINIKTGETDKQ